MSRLGEEFGVLAGASLKELLIAGRNQDLCQGDVFLILSTRGKRPRLFFFRAHDFENRLRYIADTLDVASTLLLEESYVVDINPNKVLLVEGRLLGYVEFNEEEECWEFFPPRRIPDHFAKVYRLPRGTADAIVRDALKSQLDGEILVGNFLAGDSELDVPVSIPASRLSMHVGIYGMTGSGKSNLMLVLLLSLLNNNREALRDPSRLRVSAFCIDPHDEFLLGTDKYGIRDIVQSMDRETKKALVGNFCYLTPHIEGMARGLRSLGRQIRILWSEIQPHDLYSIMSFSPQQIAFIDNVYNKEGENWISAILSMEEPKVVHRETLYAVKRRLHFLTTSSIFCKDGDSVLPDVFVALEQGRVLIVNTSLLSDTEQFLLTTVVARTMFDLRKSLKSSVSFDQFEKLASKRLPPTFYNTIRSIAKSFYVRNGVMRDPRDMPVILVTVEEAPSILNPEMMKGQSIFKDISRQGRKFNLGLVVVSQQVSVLDNAILSQMNTQINLRLGSDREIRACIENASGNLSGAESEFRIMARGEAILTASYRDISVPIRIPKFDDQFLRDRERYKTETTKKPERHRI